LLTNLPKISIVTPTYNRADYLEETILSVINQNYPNLEYIIIDGGSIDGTVEIIKKYEKYLTYWISEPDEGMYFAIQKGFEKSTGEIMAWLNSDDKFHEGALFSVAQIFTDLPNVEWIIGMPSMYNSEGLCVKISANNRWSISRFQVGDYRWIQQESVFWKRELWAKVGNKINMSFKYASDFELWCRFFMQTKLYPVSTSFAGFRLHNNQLSITYLNEYEYETNEILKKFQLKFGNIFKFNFIKKLWLLKCYLATINSIITKNLAKILLYFIDKLHSYPDLIYFDFDKNKWKK